MSLLSGLIGKTGEITCESVNIGWILVGFFSLLTSLLRALTIWASSHILCMHFSLLAKINFFFLLYCVQIGLRAITRRPGGRQRRGRQREKSLMEFFFTLLSRETLICCTKSISMANIQHLPKKFIEVELISFLFFPPSSLSPCFSRHSVSTLDTDSTTNSNLLVCGYRIIRQKIYIHVSLISWRQL